MAKKKAPKSGLGSILYVRASPKLLAQLDARAAKERKEEPGRIVSRADVARRLLWEALK